MIRYAATLTFVVSTAPVALAQGPITAGPDGGWPSQAATGLVESGRGLLRARHVPPNRWIITPASAFSTWTSDTIVPRTAIQAEWNRGRRIVDVSYGNRYWVFITAPDAANPPQSYWYAREWPQAFVDSLYGLDYRMTSLAYGDSLYFVVMTRNSFGPAQRVRSHADLHVLAREAFADTFRITSLVFARGSWTAVQTRDPARFAQRVHTAETWPAAWLDSATRDGYEITEALHGQGLYAIVASQIPRGRAVTHTMTGGPAGEAPPMQPATAPQSAGALADVSAGSSIRYSGVYAALVRQLLSRVSGWRTPTCMQCSDGSPPTIPADLPCTRDTHVYAAVSYAWAAEAAARLNEPTQASDYAQRMRAELNQADALRSSAAVSSGGRACVTLGIY